MGNRIGRRKAAVEERYTRPQGLYEHRDIDQKKLRKLILESKLAPCYPGDDECSAARGDLEECPICCLYYPSLNRSKCCTKGICTECFLQMKPTHTARPTHKIVLLNQRRCPFCKTPNYAVEYRGVKTKEERSIEQVEEQKVIEAQIRMRQQELQDEADKMKRKQDRCSSSRIMTPTEVEYRDICSTSLSVPSYRCTTQGTGCDSFQPSCSAQASIRSLHSRHNRDDNIDLDLEEMMVMEAIWLSIQEQGSIGNPVSGSCMPMEPHSHECQMFLPAAPVEVPPSGGFACAVAALAEHQPLNMDYSHIASSSAPPVFDMLRRPCSIAGANMCAIEASSPDSWIGISPNCSREVAREEGECSADHWSEAAEAGTSYAGSDIMVDGGGMPSLPFPESFSMAPGHLLPESIEEQMMLSMAVSLAEAHGRTHAPGLAWL